MKLTLTEDDGTLLDETQLDREEFQAAKDSPPLAQAILRDLEAGG